jgi:hypothetical protein
VSAELCPYRIGQTIASKGGSGGGTTLGEGPAKALARAFASGEPAGALGATCATVAPSVVVRFSYGSGTTVPVDIVTFGCSQPVAYASGKGRLVNPALATMLPAMSFPPPAIPMPGSPGPAAPNVFGESPSAAA